MKEETREKWGNALDWFLNIAITAIIVVSLLGIFGVIKFI